MIVARVNPRSRKVKVLRARRAFLDRPEQIVGQLDAAGALNREAANAATAIRACGAL